MRLVDTSDEAQALRAGAFSASNDLFTLSLRARGLAGLLELIAGNRDDLTEQQSMAFGQVAEIAQQIENEITAIADRLNEAMDSDKAPAP